MNRFKDAETIKGDEFKSVLVDILKANHEINLNTHKITARNELLQSRLIHLQLSQKEQDEASSNEEEVPEVLSTLGARNAIKTFGDLINSARSFFSTNKQAKMLGYSISYPEFQALEYMQVNDSLLT